MSMMSTTFHDLFDLTFGRHDPEPRGVAQKQQLILAWKLSGTESSLSDVLVRHVSAVLAGTAVLLVLAPLLALYYQTSAWAGPMIAIGGSSLAVIVALTQAVRKTLAATPESASRAAALLPIAVLGIVQLATLLQLLALAAPIVPEVTAFEGGLDGMFGAH